MITTKMADRMAQHDKILERKIHEEEQRIAALTKDEQDNGEVERMYAALDREMDSVPTPVAVTLWSNRAIAPPATFTREDSGAGYFVHQLPTPPSLSFDVTRITLEQLRAEFGPPPF